MGEVLKGTFEWSIDRFLERKGEEKKSAVFPVWEANCYFYIPSRNGTCSSCLLYYPLYLTNVSKLTRKDDRNLKLCLIGQNGKEVSVINRTMINLFSSIFLLMTFSDRELRENGSELLPEDKLTVRLSWYEDRDEGIRDEESGTFLETLSKDLSTFYESKANTDCILRVGDAQFPVHRAVLSARSEVFAAMFHHDTSETRSGIVDISDVEAAVLGDFLHYLYSGKVHGLTTNTACPLYVVADKYALNELKNFCVEFLKNALTVGNICNAAVLAHTYAEEELEEKVVQFIQDRLEEVQDSVEWKMLSSSKPSLIIKLLSCTVLACKNKIQEMSEK